MTEYWHSLLPQEYQDSVVQPQVFERHVEPSVRAEKIIGRDANGEQCFYFHSFVLSEEGFDVDEFPIQIDLYYERVVAWRLLQGNWVRLKSFSDRIDQCNKQMTTLPAEVTDSAPR